MNITNLSTNFNFSVFCVGGGCQYTQRIEFEVPLVTITKCMRIVILAAAAQAGEDGGNQS